MSPIRALIALLFLILSVAAVAETYVPDDLKDWQQWVLKDKEYRQCPFYFDRLLDQPDAFVCAWPGELGLTVNGSGAEFSQQWTVYAKERWVALAGNSDYWPDRVTVNDQAIEVIARNEVPSIKLKPG